MVKHRHGFRSGLFKHGTRAALERLENRISKLVEGVVSQCWPSQNPGCTERWHQTSRDDWVCAAEITSLDAVIENSFPDATSGPSQ